MKAFVLPVFLLLLAIACLSAESTPTELSLNDGSRIKGRVMSVTASEVTVMADFGVLRIDLAKLTPESRAKLAEANKPDTEALLRRVAELEARVSQLQQENEQLRRQVVSVRSTPPSYRPSTSGVQSLTTSGGGSTATAGRAVSISSTGKRHNSGCRYYAGGRPCGPTDGIACKLCGG
ncbi:hypothetical protein DES53_107293 [Roseimicrobium gellanilyticum]|uniref:Uncharacterized protein n=1 Tax=Roseimicrobium gellanilyticum TaxID=748857 RepID=A0A366HGZ7_9BACT|nr:hypothetical protein DES53_107293 [Roseimicrobium gellanilyticum]